MIDPTYLLLACVMFWLLLVIAIFVHCALDANKSGSQKAAWFAGILLTLTLGIIPYALIYFRSALKFLPLGVMVLGFAYLAYIAMNPVRVVASQTRHSIELLNEQVQRLGLSQFQKDTYDEKLRVLQDEIADDPENGDLMLKNYKLAQYLGLILVGQGGPKFRDEWDDLYARRHEISTELVEERLKQFGARISQPVPEPAKE